MLKTWWILALGLLAVSSAQAVEITLLHTNDLHSHFRPDRDALGLGGFARLKTAIQSIRNQTQYSFLVDGGDFSEGSVYYNEGAGIETMKLMDRMGYDVAVIGNHDWLNGPDVLLNAIEKAQPKMSFVSANLSTENYAKSQEFKKWIPGYVIRTVGGVKVAFIGLSTFELIYDKYVSPVNVTEPFVMAGQLAAYLKGQKGVNAVVVISHNSIDANKGVLKLGPAIDLVVGAHDHVKLTRPVVVERTGAKPGWIVETGSWGKFLGRVDLSVDRNGVSLNQYRLIQMDASIPEDPDFLKEIEASEARLEGRYGPIFHDHVGQIDMELSKTGYENDMGNFMADAYLQATGADFALECSKFINGVLHEGPVRSADVINSNSLLYNPSTQKMWSVQTLPMKGRTLKWLLYAIYSTRKVSSLGILSASGLSFTHDPLFATGFAGPIHIENPLPLLPEFGSRNRGVESIPVVKDIRVRGVPLDPDKVYRVALGKGLVEAFEFLNTQMWNLISLDQVVDTGLENWRLMADYLSSHSPLNRERLPIGNRIRPLKADLGVLYDAVKWLGAKRLGDEIEATLQVGVTNYGATPSEVGSILAGPQIHILTNRNGTDYSKDLDYQEIGEIQGIPALAPGESKQFTWNVKLPAREGLYPITVRLEGIADQIDTDHGEVTRWFKETD